jgi:hypothetical protein
MQGSLTPNDLFEMLQNMGQPVKKEDLKRLGIRYDFEKKMYSVYAKINRTHKQHTQGT